MINETELVNRLKSICRDVSCVVGKEEDEREQNLIDKIHEALADIIEELSS